MPSYSDSMNVNVVGISEGVDALAPLLASSMRRDKTKESSNVVPWHSLLGFQFSLDFWLPVSTVYISYAAELAVPLRFVQNPYWACD